MCLFGFSFIHTHLFKFSGGIGVHFGDMKLTDKHDPTKLDLTNIFGNIFVLI